MKNTNPLIIQIMQEIDGSNMWRFRYLQFSTNNLEKQFDIKISLLHIHFDVGLQIMKRSSNCD